MDLPTFTNVEPIPGYRLLERLGRGGYGEVWKCEAPGGIHKAIKFVSGNADSFGDDGKAAEQEFKSLNRVKTIRHPFLLSIERFEVIDGQLIIVMELADRNLWDRFSECQKHGLPGIPRPEILRYVEEAAEALDLMNLHHQIQHLDIKPQNIFLVHQHVKVADFGLAKDLEGARTDLTGGITPTYAPPETFEGWVSRQSDQYSLAIVYQEMLTGRRPFTGTNTRQLVLQHLTAVPDLSPLPPADRAAVGRALSKVPDERFPTCADFVRALRGEAQPVMVPAADPLELLDRCPADENDTDVPDGATRFVPRTQRRPPPALVTPGSRLSVTPTQFRRSVVQPVSGPKPPSVPTERVGQGVLVPALIVGVGGIGLAVLRGLRQLVSERFGKVTLPHLRWLYIDTDQAGVEAAVGGPTAGALSRDDVLLAPLRRPTHYLKREGLPAVDSWLPEEELFHMPRTPATEGVRGLGRLALCDHYHVVRHRVRTAMEPFLTAGAVEEADRLTRLGIRTTFPRVYLAASLAGGTGSGMFLDLAYLIRREAQQLGFGTQHLVGLLGVPTFSTEARDAAGMANAKAALTELHHFGTVKAGYQALFDTREGPVGDPERPFRRTILLPLGNRSDPDGPGRAADAAAHVAFADLLTPMGRAAHPDGAGEADSSIALVGIRRLAWPREAVLRSAGWRLARRTLQSWAGKGSSKPSPAAAAAVDAQWGEHQFDLDTVGPVLDRMLTKAIGMLPEELIDGLLHPLAGGSRDGGSNVPQARAALKSLMELLGRPGAVESEHPYEFGLLLDQKVREVAAQADPRLGGAVITLVEQPGLRVAGAEDAIRLLRQRIAGELALADRQAAAIDDEALAQFVSLHHELLTAAGDPTARPARQPSYFVSQLRHWALTRVQALVARACASVYRVWLGNLPEYVRELTAIRNQLLVLVAQLDSDPPSDGPSDGVSRAVFPDGEGTIDDAAARIIKGVGADQVRAFESELQARIRHEFRGLAAICNRPRDAGSIFLGMLVDQATRFLDSRTARLPASQVLTLQAQGADGLREKVAELVATAAPAALGPECTVSPTLAVLATPVDEAAGRLIDLVRNLSPGCTFRTAPSSEDIVLYQESTAISLTSLPHLTTELAVTRPTSGGRRPMRHARTDVSWIPVGPQ